MAMSEHSELYSFMENLNGKLDEASIDIIRQTVEVSGFTSRLQIKLKFPKGTAHLRVKQPGF